ncbi:MAG: AAA family ATPase [Clostridium sp.]|nr:AAA family ATPase [Clostridium sp.]
MARVIAVCNQKGGVGKTTTTANLGFGLVREGKRVLLVDADPQGDLTTCLGWRNPDNLEVTLSSLLRDNFDDRETDIEAGILHHEEGVDLIPANIELSALEMQLVTVMSREIALKNLLKDAEERYDYIIIDCMPSLGMMTINSLTAADSVVIPVQAEYLPTKGMTQLIQTINRVRKHINPELKIEGILITLADGRTNLTCEITDIIRNDFGKHVKIFDVAIPRGVAASKATSTGKSIYEFDNKSAVSQAYKQFTAQIIGDSPERVKEVERDAR